jgi:hypothetical protein
MNLNVTQKQFDALESGQREAILVRNERTRKEYAIISQATFEQLQPLLKHATAAKNGSPADNERTTWTEAKNARRVALINKKYDDKLSRTEARELSKLESELDQYQEEAAPLNNHVLELILEGLKQRAKREKDAG